MTWPAIAACLLAVALSGGEAALELPRLSVPFLSSAPRGDADRADTAWASALVIPSLAPCRGGGQTADPGTEVRLGWTTAALWLRFTCRDADPFLPTTERDGDLYTGDAIEVFLDPVGDARMFVEVQANAGGAFTDILHLVTGDPHLLADGVLAIASREQWTMRAWNADGLRCTGLRQADGWTVDLALPAKPLLQRLGQTDWQAGQALRVALLRIDHPLAADGKRGFQAWSWGPVPNGRPHRAPGAYGHLVLAEPVSGPTK
jgi:hypothetical protein